MPEAEHIPAGTPVRIVQPPGGCRIPPKPGSWLGTRGRVMIPGELRIAPADTHLPTWRLGCVGVLISLTDPRLTGTNATLIDDYKRRWYPSGHIYLIRVEGKPLNDPEYSHDFWTTPLKRDEFEILTPEESSTILTALANQKLTGGGFRRTAKVA